MNNNTLTDWGQSNIDSRDIISRHEELSSDIQNYVDSIDDAKFELSEFNSDITPTSDNYDKYIEAFNRVTELVQELQEYRDEYSEEIALLDEIISQGENSSDWSHGETLIHESMFTEYIRDLVEDCYESPSENDMGSWPWRHMTMDWDGAADEAKMDYATIEALGETYYIRA